MSPPAATVTDMPPNIGDVKIFTAAGEPVFFRDLWDQSEGMAVVALLRHFGCPLCWELAAKLKEAKPRLDSAGVKLIAIGAGTPEKARLLAERLPFPMDSLYADPECKSYDVLGLYRGVRRTFFSPTIAKVFSRFGAVREANKNYTFKAMPDDKSIVWQQGGMFVLKGQQLLYGHRDEATGDHAPMDDIFDICCKVPTVVQPYIRKPFVGSEAQNQGPVTVPAQNSCFLLFVNADYEILVRPVCPFVL